MSDYLQVQDVIDYLPTSQEDGLYWDDNLDGQNTEWIQADINCAESDIESYIGRYYQLPATEVDNPISFGILKCITMDITVALAYKRSACGMPEEVLMAFENAMKKLKDFRDEKAFLSDLPLVEETGLGRTELFTEDPIMNQTRMGTMW
jgi:hypothetical protein